MGEAKDNDARMKAYEEARSKAYFILDNAMNDMRTADVGPAVAYPLVAEMGISGLMALDVKMAKITGTPLTFERADKVIAALVKLHKDRAMADFLKGAEVANDLSS